MKKKYLLFMILVSFCVALSFSSQSMAQSLVDDDYESVEVMPDPMQNINEKAFRFNELADKVIRPSVKFWRWAVPSIVRRKLDNAYKTYAHWPKRFGNAVLQAPVLRNKEAFKKVGLELIRPVVNTASLTLYDCAAKMHMPAPKEEDFGQTLGVYGMPHLFYLVVPIIGPSSGRDFIGFVVDTLSNPVNWLLLPFEALAVGVTEKANNYSINLQWVEGIEQDAFNSYIFVRNAYFQNREAKVKNEI